MKSTVYIWVEEQIEALDEQVREVEESLEDAERRKAKGLEEVEYYSNLVTNYETQISDKKELIQDLANLIY